ncbi:MAG: DinB family protein [Gemmatimonadaceae bacterium]
MAMGIAWQRLGGREWEVARGSHAAAVSEFVSAATALPENAWHAPRAEGKWSPAQITEHLSLAFAAALSELDGGRGVRMRGSRLRRLLLRRLLLPRLLTGATFPAGVRSPSEARPGDVTASRREGLDRMTLLARRFEEQASRSSGRDAMRVTHPYFGALPALQGLRFSAAHIRHHKAQLLSRAGGQQAPG